MRKWIFAAVCAATLVFAGAASAAPATHYVSKTGADTGTCTSTPCLTIVYAVGQANAGDTISVGTGTYAESVSVTKQLTLAGSAATIDAATEAEPSAADPSADGKRSIDNELLGRLGETAGAASSE